VENIALYIAGELRALMLEPNLLYKVKVEETEKNSATVYLSDF
jgi:hypothetical protein